MKIMWTKKAIEKIVNSLIKVGVLDKVVSDAATPNTIAGRNTNGNVIVATPTANGHAATKKYVDDAVAGAGGVYLHKITFQHAMITDSYGTIYVVSGRSTAYTQFDTIPSGVYAADDASVVHSGDAYNVKAFILVNGESQWTVAANAVIYGSGAFVYGVTWDHGDVNILSDTVTPI